mgnify:CR=1 FL=1
MRAKINETNKCSCKLWRDVVKYCMEENVGFRKEKHGTEYISSYMEKMSRMGT